MSVKLIVKTFTISSLRWRMVFLLALLTAIGWAIAAHVASNFPGDEAITHWAQGYRAEWFKETMKGISATGTLAGLAGLSAVALLVMYLRKAHRFHLAALPMAATGGVLVPILKELIARPRPSADEVYIAAPAGGTSFPSGHAFMAVVILGALFYLAGKICGENRAAVVALRTILVLGILAIGASRVYLGAHWTSDVLGGYLMGGLTLFAAIRLFESLHRRFVLEPA